MEKLPSPKNRKLVKEPDKKEKGAPAMQETGTERLRKRGGYGVAANPFGQDSEVNAEISVETIPWQAVSDRERALLNSAISLTIDRATEVIGDRKEAMRWLGAPVRGLDFATPISLLATEEGQTRVNDILGQMEHGIW